MVICKSKTRLKSIYHRILFFMSTSDVLASIAVALTTSVIPKDMMYKNMPPADENWPIYGGTAEATYNVQGFIFLTFNTLAFFSDVILCIYYLCSINFRMNDNIFSSRFQGLLYFLAIAISLNLTAPNLVIGNIDPNPDIPWCLLQTYPYDCEGDDCIRRDQISKEKTCSSHALTLMCIVVISMLCLGVVVLHVYRNERAAFEEHCAAEPRTETVVFHKDMMMTCLQELMLHLFTYTKKTRAMQEIKIVDEPPTAPRIMLAS